MRIEGRFTTALVILLVLAGAAGSGAAAQQNVFVTSGRPAWLGISYDTQWIQDDDGCEPRVLVQSVVQGSPAERAGLRSGDVLVELDGAAIPGGHLAGLASRLHPGDSIRLRVRRDGRMHEITAVAARRPERPPLALVPSAPDGLRATVGPVVRLEGATLVARNVDAGSRGSRGYWLATGDGHTEYRRINRVPRDELDERVVRLLRCVDRVEWSGPAPPNPQIAQVQRRADSLRVVITRRALEREPTGPMVAPAAPAVPTVGRQPELAGAALTELEPELAEYFRNARRGLLVLRIAPDTPAQRAGLRPGDVIVQADGRRLESVAELRRVLSFPDPQPVELRVVRKGSTRTITLARR